MCKLKKGIKNRWSEVVNKDKTFLSLSTFEELGEIALKEKKQKEESIEGLVTKECIEVKECATQTEHIETSKYKKPFLELKDAKKQRKRTDTILSEVKAFCASNSLTISQAVGFLLHRHYYFEKRELAEIGGKLYREQEDTLITAAEVPTLVAMWLVERLNLGRSKYTNTRLLLLR